MKCININGVYQRVNNEVADHEVRMGRAQFAPKSEWKKNTRDVKSAEVVVAEQKGADTKTRRADKHSKIKSKQRTPEYTDRLLK